MVFIPDAAQTPDLRVLLSSLYPLVLAPVPERRGETGACERRRSDPRRGHPRNAEGSWHPSWLPARRRPDKEAHATRAARGNSPAPPAAPRAPPRYVPERSTAAGAPGPGGARLPRALAGAPAVYVWERMREVSRSRRGGRGVAFVWSAPVSRSPRRALASAGSCGRDGVRVRLSAQVPSRCTGARDVALATRPRLTTPYYL